ncbi:zinc metalloprotease [Robertkochia flava]|uniref:membrane metalloprotease n=1 Tax=Robertkochia flava TaxID=3447986 RepID=UPI001CCFF0C3|nr:membrane metalloprotease [Robertkochia marina]
MIKRFSPIVLFLITSVFLIGGCSPDTEDSSVSFAANRKSTGASAKDLLTARNFDKIIFDIVYVEGHSPGTNSINNLISFAEQRCYKSEGIRFKLTAIPDQGKTVYETQDILEIEEAYRTAYNEGDQLSVFILVLNGDSSKNAGNSVILGTAYRNTSFVIFEETIRRYSYQFISNDKTVLESTVLCHEFSHLLGLVNLGTSLNSDHEDPENSHHCSVPACLMNYQTDAGIDPGQISLGGGVPTLDEQCLADLRTLGGK